MSPLALLLVAVLPLLAAGAEPPVDRARLPASGLELLYDAADPASNPQPNTGSTWADLSGNSRDGTIVGAVDTTGGDMVFSTQSTYVDTGVTLGDLGSSFTIVLRVRATAAGVSGAGTYNAWVGSAGEGFFWGPNSQLGAHLGLQYGNWIPTFAQQEDVLDANEHAMTLTVAGSTGTMFIDGERVGSDTYTGASSTLGITIGRELDGFAGQSSFGGSIGAVAFYSRVLNDTEIHEASRAFLALPDMFEATESVMRLDARLPASNNGAGADWLDVSGNGNHAQLQGSTVSATGGRVTIAGATDLVRTPLTVGDLDALGTLTMAVLVRQSSGLATFQAAFGSDALGVSGGSRFFLGLSASSGVLGQFGSNGVGGTITDLSGAEYKVFLATVAADRYRAYVDGTLMFSAAVDRDVTDAHVVLVGNDIEAVSLPLLGDYLAAYVFGRRLSDHEKALLAAEVTTPTTVGCDDTPETPTLVSSSISGADLVLEFESDPALASLSWNFVGGAGCDNDGTDATGGWAHAEGDCVSTHTLTKPVTELLATCGFSAEPVDGGDVWYYEAVVEATAVNNSGSVFGDAQTRTDLTSFRLRVEFPKDVAVNGTAGVFGAVIDQSALTEQTFDSVTQEFGWNLATSVQYPYYLEPVSTAVSGGHTFDTLPVVASGGDCVGFGTDAAPAACRQDFALSANETDDCLVPAGTTVTVTFQILCRPQYAGSCDLPEGNTTTASFSVETDDFCPQVVEVASITPELTTYSDSDRTSVSTNYILETTLFARVTADVEAGLRALRTTLTGLDIVSSCTGCTPLVQPFTDTSAALAAYNFQYAAGGTDNSATGEVETDFSFTLNTNSLSFDNDASTGEAQITLTAYVSVEYDTPSAQGLARSYRVQAVSGPGSIGSSATAQAGVSSQPSAGSSTTAGSTVLGVSTGTAALAAVGLAAVAAIAVGAAVAASRRRHAARPAQKAVASSSTSASLELGTGMAAAAVPAAVPGMATDDLGTVQAAYETSV